MHRTISPIKQHSFTPGAMSIIQMGEELIGHPSTAINELVKNGYDADADYCKVYLYHSENVNNSFAFVFDDGSGMNDKTLFGDWLKPSVSSKRTEYRKSKKYERTYLGSKGIGRLAAMALGKVITVVTKQKTETSYNWITIDRELFREDNLLSEIKFPGASVENVINLFTKDEYSKARSVAINDTLAETLVTAKCEAFTSGTLIIIEKLDDSVLKILKDDHQQIETPEDGETIYATTTFFKSLSTLITPLELNDNILRELKSRKILSKDLSFKKSKNPFSIKYGTNLLPGQDELEWLDVYSVPIHSIYDYRAFGKVTFNGEVFGKLSYNRIKGDVFEEKFEIAELKIEKELEQGRLFNPVDTKNNKKTFEPGEFYFDIRVYDMGESDNVEKLAHEAKYKSITSFRKDFKEFQGLRVSKNGFGVKPYGEEVEDWIGLSKARVQNPGQNVNTNQILGYIYFISPENDELEEKTNREGFLENKAFIQVKEVLGSIFSVLGKRRYNYRLTHGLGRPVTSKHKRPDFEEYLDSLKALNASQKVISSTEKFMKDVSTSMDNMEESLTFSERLAALGSGIELLYHELAQPLSGLRTAKSSFELKKKKVDPSVLDNFVADINTLHHSTEIIYELRQSLQPAIGRTRKKKFKVLNTFLKVCNLYKSDTEEHNIKIIADDRLENYEITDIEYAFWISFLNIINNAVYWIKQSGNPGEIRIHLEKEAIVVSNSGPLINNKYIDFIFDYGVTTRQEKNATGLGLSFTRSILTKNNWDISAENRSYGPAFILIRTKDE
ncbi:sensor histidine kinase [uncultured Draconibacterium sp.]|uniref:sensor histidine kinase n=1 Tax=uncultured Draconibacterium sp. TaxID=1573823 RepID=UPI00321715F4